MSRVRFLRPGTSRLRAEEPDGWRPGVATEPEPSDDYGGAVPAHRPLPFDPIARAGELWAERIGPSATMAAVTNIMRVQQILQQAVDTVLRPYGLTFARYEALVLLSFSRRNSLPMRVMGERLQLHPTSVTRENTTSAQRAPRTGRYDKRIGVSGFKPSLSSLCTFWAIGVLGSLANFGISRETTPWRWEGRETTP